MNTRISIIEQEQKLFKQKIEKIEESLDQHSMLLKQIFQFIQKDGNNGFQQQGITENIIEGNIHKQIVKLTNADKDFNKKNEFLNNQILKQSNNNDEIKPQQEQQILSFLNTNQNDLWQTWKEILPYKTQPQLTVILLDYKGCKTQGQRRVFYNKDGVKFEKIVKMLINILKQEPENPGYAQEVSRQLKGLEICQGFKIKHVLGAGSIGTTVLAYDNQEDKDIALKIYHVQHSMTSGLREYQMLHFSQLAPSIVKVHSLMYNSTGSFLAISMEDLSEYLTVYNFVNQEEVHFTEKLIIVRNIARALSELHKIKIVHGDIASENILINSQKQDIKIIDFDISSKEGEKLQAVGNPDFITLEIQKDKLSLQL